MIFNRGNSNVNFEGLLKKEASKYRMYPSEKVWENIREEIQPETKWPALITIFTSIVLALTISTIINYPIEKVITSKIARQISIKNVATQKSIVNSTAFLAENFYHKKLESKNNISKATETQLTKVEQVVNTKSQHILNSLASFDDHRPNEFNEVVVSTQEKNLEQNINQNETQSSDISEIKQTDIGVSNFIKNNIQPELIKTNLIENGLDFVQKLNKKKSNNWNVQYYVTLSNSFRTLDDDKSRSRFISSLTERIALNKNVNDVVSQKPMLGAEIGAAVLHKLVKNVYLKTGLQFNIRQYNIDAFNAYGAANISYINNNQLNTYSVISGLSTNTENALGAKTNLQNKLYELSVPIGLEWSVVNGNKWGITLFGSIEPTVALNKSNYIVSTDYKYYTDATPFFRSFNINTSTGMNFTLKTKNLKWFLGPQIRFQKLPTYNDLYPIKEYRIDYGIKVGFTKPL